MKKFITLLFLLVTFVSLSVHDITYFRNQFNRTTNEAKARNYINTKIEKGDLKDKITIEAYKGVVTMRMAEYVINPFSKIGWFKEGKEILEKSIQMNRNVETVHLRLMVQINAPSFLDYKGNIEKDSDYILKNLDKSSISIEAKRMILVNLLANDKTNRFTQLAKKYGVK